MSEFTRAMACAFINETPALQSLLYDINLLPELPLTLSQERMMMLIVAHWREASYQHRKNVEYAERLRAALEGEVVGVISTVGIVGCKLCGAEEGPNGLVHAIPCLLSGPNLVDGPTGTNSSVPLTERQRFDAWLRLEDSCNELKAGYRLLAWEAWQAAVAPRVEDNKPTDAERWQYGCKHGFPVSWSQSYPVIENPEVYWTRSVDDIEDRFPTAEAAQDDLMNAAPEEDKR